jgi:hypothetical protein
MVATAAALAPAGLGSTTQVCHDLPFWLDGVVGRSARRVSMAEIRAYVAGMAG